MSQKAGNAKKVYLALTKGIPAATDVVKALADSGNFEAAEVMTPIDGSQTEITQDFKALLPNVKFSGCNRFEFYEKACSDDIRLAISTGEQRFYGCIILTIYVA